MTPGPLWSGRFASGPAQEAHELGRSLHYDERLAREDAQAGIAHVAALLDAGLLTGDEAIALSNALLEIAEDIDAGDFEFEETDEDIHSAIERAVTAKIGDTGAKLHAGRSRNDLVVTDTRLWLLAEGARVRLMTGLLVEALIERVKEYPSAVMPGTTHARFAQPVTLGHHLMAHVWGLLRDMWRFHEWHARASVSPLGAGAIATSTLGLDPAKTAERLGFDRRFENSIDAVGDRDFAQEYLACAAILATHVSRLAADIARWTDESLGWAEMDEGYSTGSSMMPQKRNPDTAELARGKASRITGDFVALTSLLQGLPMGYHRDLQEDKEPLFDATDTLQLVLPAMTGAVGTLKFNTEAMRQACSAEGLYATDLAEALVRSGVPFREAHHRTGTLLKQLDEQGRGLAEMKAEEWQEFGVPQGASLLDADHAVASRDGKGGPSAGSVMAQAAQAIELLSEYIFAARKAAQ